MHVFKFIRDLEWNNPERTRATGQVEIVGHEGLGAAGYTFDVKDYVIENVHVRSAEPKEDGTFEDVPYTAAELFAAFRAGTFGEVKAYVAPPPPPYVPIVIPSAIFFGRMTDEEAEALDGAMMAKPVRVRSAWAGVSMQGRDVREDQPLLWDALRAEIVVQFGDAKTAEWLARPMQAMARAADEDVAAT